MFMVFIIKKGGIPHWGICHLLSLKMNFILRKNYLFVLSIKWLQDQFHLMQGVVETLAGLIAILNLLGLAQAEIHDKAATSQPFLPTTEWIDHARPLATVMNVMDIYYAIWRGSFP